MFGCFFLFFFFQAEDGIRDHCVTGVQTCALPISPRKGGLVLGVGITLVVTLLLLATVRWWAKWFFAVCCLTTLRALVMGALGRTISVPSIAAPEIGRASCRERGSSSGVGVSVEKK